MERLTGIVNEIVEAAGVMVRLVSVLEGIPMESRVVVDECRRAMHVDIENRMRAARSLFDATEQAMEQRQEQDRCERCDGVSSGMASELLMLMSRVRAIVLEARLMCDARVGGSSCVQVENEIKLG